MGGNGKMTVKAAWEGFSNNQGQQWNGPLEME